MTGLLRVVIARGAVREEESESGGNRSLVQTTARHKPFESVDLRHSPVPAASAENLGTHRFSVFTPDFNEH